MNLKYGDRIMLMFDGQRNLPKEDDSNFVKTDTKREGFGLLSGLG